MTVSIYSIAGSRERSLRFVTTAITNLTASLHAGLPKVASMCKMTIRNLTITEMVVRPAHQWRRAPKNPLNMVLNQANVHCLPLGCFPGIVTLAVPL